MRNKQQLRRYYRALRNSINAEYSILATEKICTKTIEVLNKCASGTIIAVYDAIDNEVDISSISPYLSELGCKLLVPHAGVGEGFWLYNGELTTYSPEIVVTPLIAFDHRLNRLGFGKGWYDRTIAMLRPYGAQFIGVAYECQLCAELPVGSFDMPLDIVVTEDKVRTRNSAKRE